MDEQIVKFLRGRGATDEEIQDFIEQQERIETFKKKYREDHKCCPKCGAEGHSTTLAAFVVIDGQYDKYKDRNDCVCSNCGDKHIAHDRVPKKL